jgi:hypothetical protein
MNEFLNQNDYKDLILKFMIKVQRLMISKKVFGSQNKPKRRKKVKKKDTGAKSDNDCSDNSYINKTISDNELKSKENFYNVMQNLTNNMLNEMKGNGKELPINIEDNAINEIIVKSKSNGNSIVKNDKFNNSIVRSQEISITKRKDEIVRESEIQIIVGNNKMKSFDKLEKSEANNIAIANEKKVQEEVRPIQPQQPVIKKKESGCKCYIF